MNKIIKIIIKEPLHLPVSELYVYYTVYTSFSYITKNVLCTQPSFSTPNLKSLYLCTGSYPTSPTENFYTPTIIPLIKSSVFLTVLHFHHNGHIIHFKATVISTDPETLSSSHRLLLSVSLCISTSR